MPLYLRKIRKNRWDVTKHSWLNDGDLPADVFSDLATQDNTLSVWLIEDDRSNLEDVIAALATAPRVTNLSPIDYCLADRESVEMIGIVAEATPGDTRDRVVNQTWHRDLTQLSADKLHRLAHEFVRKRQPSRYTLSDVRKSVQASVNRGRIRWDELNDDIKNKLMSP